MGDVWSTFVFIVAIIAAFIPILLWGYLFSYFDNTPMNGRRFAVGILGGIVSVPPILYLGDILHSVGLDSWDILPILATPPLGAGWIVPSLTVITILVAVCILIMSLLSTGGTCLRTSSVSIRNIILFSGFSFVLTGMAIVIGYSGFASHDVENAVTVSGVTFGTVGSVILYYLFVGYSEEMGKHFSFIASSLPGISSRETGLILALFVALGFGFTENILYLHTAAMNSGILDSGVLMTWVFRSIFSLLVHVLCTAVLANGFLKIYLSRTPYRIMSWTVIQTIIIALTLSVILHAIYDVSLTLGFTAIIFIYFLGAYFVLTGMFYRPNHS